MTFQSHRRLNASSAIACAHMHGPRVIHDVTRAQMSRWVKPYDGAGDGNRTHVRSLGSFYTAIVRRPLVVSDCTCEFPVGPGARFIHVALGRSSLEPFERARTEIEFEKARHDCADSAERTKPNTLCPCCLRPRINGRPIAPVAPASRTLISNLPRDQWSSGHCLRYRRRIRRAASPVQFARVATDQMMCSRRLIPALDRAVDVFGLTLYLACDLTRNDGRIDERRVRMMVRCGGATRRV
jgi:hypothetical protein